MEETRLVDWWIVLDFWSPVTLVKLVSQLEQLTAMSKKLKRTSSRHTGRIFMFVNRQYQNECAQAKQIIASVNARVSEIKIDDKVIVDNVVVDR